jgi:hypothetical protein
MRLQFIPIHLFRETPQVCFFDASVPHSNGTDGVIHHGPAISPPDHDGSEQDYVINTRWITTWCCKASAPSSRSTRPGISPTT